MTKGRRKCKHTPHNSHDDDDDELAYYQRHLDRSERQDRHTVKKIHRRLNFLKLKEKHMETAARKTDFD